MDVRLLLDGLEREDDPTPGLAYLAAQSVDLDGHELRAALRRALLLLAAGGDPRRGLDPEGRAVRAVAADLAGEEQDAQLAGALRTLRSQAGGLTRVAAVLDGLLADRELARRWLACALLADELSGPEEPAPSKG